MKNLISGENLFNNTKHPAKTNSVGFCFFNIDDFKPEEAMHFLSGIVNFDICAVFETDKNLDKTYGVYAKPLEQTEDVIEDLFNLLLGFKSTEGFQATEYSTTSYNNKTFKLLKYTENIWGQWNKPDKQSNLNWKE